MRHYYRYREKHCVILAALPLKEIPMVLLTENQMVRQKEMK
jgi:hypothetical protein